MRAHASSSAPRPGVGVVSLSAPVGRDDVARLCEQVRKGLRASGARVVVCDVDGVGQPDIGIVDALARMQLVARRNGGEVRLRCASGQLLDLIRFVGLAKVLPLHPGLFAPRQRRPIGFQPRW